MAKAWDWTVLAVTGTGVVWSFRQADWEDWWGTIEGLFRSRDLLSELPQHRPVRKSEPVKVVKHPSRCVADVGAEGGEPVDRGLHRDAETAALWS